MSERAGELRASAARATLWFAVAGLALAAAMASTMDVRILQLPQVWLGGLGVGCGAWWSARSLARWLAPRGVAGAALLGALQAIGCLVLGVVLGAIPGLVQGAVELRASNMGDWLFDWLVKPLYWVLLVGSLPAIVLGASCGLAVRWRLRSLLAVAGRDDRAGRQDPDDRHEREQQERD